MRRAFLFFLTLLAAIAGVQAQAPDAAQKKELNIEPQALDDALLELGRQTGLTVMVGDNVVAHKISVPGLKGLFTAEEALQKLLVSTKLRVDWDGKTVMVVRQLADEGARVEKKKPRQQPPIAKDPSRQDSSGLDQVVVTGTNIPGARPSTSSLRIFTRKDIDQSGAVTADEFVQTLLLNFSLISGQTSTGAGTNPQAVNNVGRGAAIDIRGLGPGATLVLINGHRLAPGGYDGSFDDVSLLPMAAVERVEVLTDGASAIYGSDAVAGVVNFVLRRDFDGFETTPSYGITTSGGGRKLGLSQLAGDKWSTGGMMLDYENHQEQPVDASSRGIPVPPIGPYQVIPAESLQNAVFTLHQKLPSGTDLSTDGFYSERDFSQDYLSDEPLVSTQSHGRAKMLGGSLTASQELPGQWRTDVIGSYAEEEESVATSASTIRELFETRSTSASVDLRAAGPVFSTPGGPVRLSVGTSLRWESFNDLVARLGPSGTGLKRNVLGAYAEALAPIIGEGDALPWAKRLELSLAIRRDEYHSGEADPAAAASDNPKIGLLWSPRAWLALRGTYATSFRVAPLGQMNTSTDTALLVPIPSTDAQRTPINTLYLTGGNSDLQPELAKSFTAGFNLTPSMFPDSEFSATYFHQLYTNRIATPPVNGPVTSIFSQVNTLGPFINMAPSTAEIDSIYEHYSSVLDPTHLGQASVQAIFDGRLQNIASIRASGVEAMLQSKIKTAFGDFDFGAEGQYLAQLDSQAAPTSPYVSFANTAFNPPKFRMKAGTEWTYAGLAASVSLDCTGSYKNTLVAGEPDVASWVVINGRISYTTGPRFKGTLLDNTEVSINVGNLMNRFPPYVQGSAGQPLDYDASNASPLGRTILIQVKKRW
jgi:iron complex outermembrane recepter protein